MLILVLWTCGFLLKTACTILEILHRIHYPPLLRGCYFFNILYLLSNYVKLCFQQMPLYSKTKTFHETARKGIKIGNIVGGTLQKIPKLFGPSFQDDVPYAYASL
jgi:hypothetical protein